MEGQREESGHGGEQWSRERDCIEVEHKLYSSREISALRLWVGYDCTLPHQREVNI